MADERRPRLAVTLGDPAGVGPEVVLKALAHPEVFVSARPLAVGPLPALERARAWLDGPARDLRLRPVASPADGVYAAGTVDVLDPDPGGFDPAACPVGVASAAGGAAAVAAVFLACDLATAGAVDAIVTAPLNKAAMHLAGHRFPGHTELLAERTGATLRIRDFGPGVPEDVLGRLFDPFFRVEDDRNRRQGGAGLGLSIARRAVAVHGGTIEARNANPGLCVEIRLVLAGDRPEGQGVSVASGGNGN